MVVAGPRIDPNQLPRPDGTEVLGYRADLVDLIGACDVAIEVLATDGGSRPVETDGAARAATLLADLL